MHGAKIGPQLGNYASPIPEWDQCAAAAGAQRRFRSRISLAFRPELKQRVECDGDNLP